MSRDSRGFTLVELLVAMAIFAILSVFAYRGLAALLESREALERDSRKWRDVALLVGRFERDLDATLNLVARNAAGTDMAPVSSIIDTGGAQVPGLALTRSGSALNQNALAAPQRIAWRFVEGRIERLAWPAVDAAPRAEPTVVPVFTGAKSLAFRFIDSRGEWRPAWGLPGTQDAVPTAVEVTLELASGERIVRLVDLGRIS